MLSEQLERRASWGDVALWGAIAGLVGGIMMAMLLMIVDLVRGVGFWHPMYLMAAFFNPAWAHTSDFALGPLLAGFLLHLFNSALFGVIFALLVRFVLPKPLSLIVGVILGMAFALGLLLFNTFALLPGVDVALLRAVTATGGMFAWWIVAHLLYGAGLGWVFAESSAGELPSPISDFGPQPASAE